MFFVIVKKVNLNVILKFKNLKYSCVLIFYKVVYLDYV